MAWIESHQQLRDHPKVARLSRLLDVHRTSAVGLLHFLWWWALDHAEDGDLTDFDCLDIALAAGWEGDPDTFVKALQDCGPGDRAGFICRQDDRLILHDWHDYAGKLVDRRVKDRERKKAQRDNTTDRPQEVRGTSDGTPAVQNRTVPNQKRKPMPVPDGTDGAEDSFEHFWTTYPRHHDTKATGGGGNKKVARDKWRKLRDRERDEILAALVTYGKVCTANGGQKPKHAERFLTNEAWKPYLPAARSTLKTANPDVCRECRQGLQGHDDQLCTILAKAG